MLSPQGAAPPLAPLAPHRRPAPWRSLVRPRHAAIPPQVLRRLRDRQGDETGALILTLGVLLILTALSLGMLARSVGSLVVVRHGEDYRAALAAADGGVADAIYRIGAGAPATFESTASVGEGQFGYTATKLATDVTRADAERWSVRSTGRVNGVPHTVKATVSREPRYPYAVFTEQDLTLNGETLGNIASTSGDVIIGSNHAVTTNGVGGGARQDYVTSCGNCDAPHRLQKPRPLALPRTPVSGLACPTITDTTTWLSGGTYVCDGDVVFGGDVRVTPGTGPVVLYVTGSHRVVFLDEARVNSDEGTRPSSFRILVAGDGVEFPRGGDVSFVGIIDAPRSTVVMDGVRADLRGSLILNQVRVNGAANLHLTYDPDVLQVPVTEWRVSDWREVPAGT